MVSLVVAVGGRGRRIVDLFNVGFRLFSNEQGGPLPSQGFPRPSPFGERPSDTDPEQGKPRVTGQYAKYGFPLLTGFFSGFVVLLARHDVLIPKLFDGVVGRGCRWSWQAYR